MPIDGGISSRKVCGRYVSRRAALSAAVVGLLALSLLTGCSGDRPGTIATQAPALPTEASGATYVPAVAQVSALATGLRVPWGIAFLPDGGALVTERDSRRVVKIGPGRTGSALTVTELGVIEEARPSGEGGLMGIAVSPHYAHDQTVFLFYTTDTDNRVARWKVGSRPEPILTGLPKAGNHNGGRLAFGPDGYLYATTGEAGRPPLAQQLDSLGGKILRMTTEGRPAPGNPFGTLVWSYGHRNVQGIAWDSGGHLWATEFGQNTWDEINRIEPGKNYGWPEVEGAAGDGRFVDPVAAWPTSESSCSGAAVLHRAGPEVLAAACLRGQRLWMMPLTATGTLAGQPVPQLVNESGRLRAVAAAPDGSLWVTTSNHDGRGDSINPDDDRILRVTLR
jgi:glucose/arabinose dehydrogenase